MIKLRDLELDKKHIDFLKKKQDKIDIEPTYLAEISKADKLWTSRSKSSEAFIEIKRLLSLICSGHVRCVFCEDSLANQIEHFQPKSVFPELCFNWNNYLYACGPCNSRKDNHFALFIPNNEKYQDVKPLHHKKRPDNYVRMRPPNGTPVLINPRKKDPEEYIELDMESFRFIPSDENTTTQKYKIAEYTLNTVLKLNRPLLPESRESAFYSFLGLLNMYNGEKKKGVSNIEKEYQDIILKNPHISVWYAMIRWYQTPKLKDAFKLICPKVYQLFQNNPEVLNWKIH